MCLSSIKLTINIVASPILLLGSLTLPLANCSKPNTTTTPYVSHISLFVITGCFNSSGTGFRGTLDSAECHNSLTLSATTQPRCPRTHNASVLCSTRSYHCLMDGLGLVPALGFLFPKLGGIPDEEPLLPPTTEFIVAWHDEQLVPVMLSLALV